LELFARSRLYLAKELGHERTGVVLPPLVTRAETGRRSSLLDNPTDEVFDRYTGNVDNKRNITTLGRRNPRRTIPKWQIPRFALFGRTQCRNTKGSLLREL